jgi:hypothetical protein
MRKSFLDEHAFPLVVIGILIAMPLAATLFVACSQPSTPEERAEASSDYAAGLKENLAILTPRPGVECYVVRGFSAANPRLMSCVVLPKESN